MLRHWDQHRPTGGGSARRRWRRACDALEDPAAPAVQAEPGCSWSLDEVGAAAIELGLFPESCLPDGPAAAERT